ncbi:hypothetical protein ACE4ZB_011145 [Enterococcus faecalis]|uniref:hypothetical protein n=1 Tax=Enterococcus faecalis TaxID=1351 RepID=UPI0035E7D9B2
MFFNFWRPSRYCSSSKHYVLRDSQQFRLISEGPSTLRALALRSCCFCSRRLLVFERRAKIQSDFCPTLFILWVKIS